MFRTRKLLIGCKPFAYYPTGSFHHIHIMGSGDNVPSGGQHEETSFFMFRGSAPIFTPSETPLN